MGQSELLEAGRGAGKGWHWIVSRPEAAREGSGSPKPETKACLAARGRGLQFRGRGRRSPRLSLLSSLSRARAPSPVATGTLAALQRNEVGSEFGVAPAAAPSQVHPGAVRLAQVHAPHVVLLPGLEPPPGPVRLCEPRSAPRLSTRRALLCRRLPACPRPRPGLWSPLRHPPHPGYRPPPLLGASTGSGAPSLRRREISHRFSTARGAKRGTASRSCACAGQEDGTLQLPGYLGSEGGTFRELKVILGCLLNSRAVWAT